MFGLTSFYLVVGRGLDEDVAQLVEHWSDYRKSFLGNFIRICLKIEQNYGLFLDIFFSAIMNDLFMTFISRLKVDAKCVHQQ